MNLPFRRGNKGAHQRAFPQLSLDDWMNQSYGFANLGNGMGWPLLQYSSAGINPEKEPPTDQTGYIDFMRQVYRTNGVVFACMLARMMHFSEARLMFQDTQNGRPGNLFWDDALDVVENPWPNGGTGDLLARAILDVDLAGNSYTAYRNGRFYRLRADWVTIILGSNSDPDRPAWSWDVEVLGYYYCPPQSPEQEEAFLVNEVAHWAPYPDPNASFRGTTWASAAMREIVSDNAMSTHQRKYFEQGACQPMDAKIAVPSGWQEMGDIEVGSTVLGPDGGHRQVLGIYPQGKKQVYRIRFSSGLETECCEDHAWQVTLSRGKYKGQHRLKTLRQMLDQGFRYPSGDCRWSVPLTEPVRYEDQPELPMAPYLLGALLGDGTFGTGSFPPSMASHADDAGEMVSYIQPALPAGVTAKQRVYGNTTAITLSTERGSSQNKLTDAIRGTGLRGATGQDKHIPEPYMRASVEDRISLLQGLIDTDGSVEKGGNVRFHNTSLELAEQTAELVRSLGGVATLTTAERKSGFANRLPSHTVYISRLPEWLVPCRLERKRERYNQYAHRLERSHYIVSATPVRTVEVQCIKVDQDDGLYLTDDFIVTHNTTNFVVSFDPSVTETHYKRWVAALRGEVEGIQNAYKVIWLGGGAQPHVVGKGLEDFRTVRGHGETRIAADAGVPPILVGLSEGLQAATYSNYTQARRHFGDTTCRWLWRTYAQSLNKIVQPIRTTQRSRLWYDLRDVAFMRQDEADQATISQAEAMTIRNLTDGGWIPESVVEAVIARDWTLLRHSGLLSVQLQPPGTTFKPSKPTPQLPPASGAGAQVIIPTQPQMDEITRHARALIENGDWRSNGSHTRA